MSDVQFDEDNTGSSYGRNFYTKEKSKIFKFVESLGVPEEYVNYVLVGFAIITIIISILMIHNSTTVSNAKPTAFPSGYYLYHNR